MSEEDILTFLKNQIEHIVIVCMENRSFDSMMGYLSYDKIENAAAINGLQPSDFNTFTRTNSKVFVNRLSDSVIKFDPGHDVHNVEKQVNDGLMDGFVDDYASQNKLTDIDDIEKVMGFYDKDFVPIYHYLFENFFVCDHWFSSVAGPTTPNRAYSMAGSSQQKKGGNNSSTQVLVNSAVHLFKSYTIFQALDGESGSENIFRRLISNFFRFLSKIFGSTNNNWRYYYHTISIAQLWTFERYVTNGFGVFEDKFSSDPFYEFDHFINDVRNDNLPLVSWIDPNFDSLFRAQNDDHPPANIQDGQEFIYKILSAFTDEEGQWRDIFDKTLIIIFYDEHGGFYDHVKPPVAKNGIVYPESNSGKTGLRVPAFLISPFIKEKIDYKASSPYENRQIKPGEIFYDHITLLKTIIDLLITDEKRKEKIFKHFSQNNKNLNIQNAQCLNYNAIFQKSKRTLSPLPKNLVSNISKSDTKVELKIDKKTQSKNQNFMKNEAIREKNPEDSMIKIEKAIFMGMDKKKPKRMHKYMKNSNYVDNTQ